MFARLRLKDDDGRWNIHAVQRVVAVKFIVMVGLISAYMLPAEAAVAVNIGANCLWLWKT